MYRFAIGTYRCITCPFYARKNETEINVLSATSDPSCVYARIDKINSNSQVPESEGRCKHFINYYIFFLKWSSACFYFLFSKRLVHFLGITFFGLVWFLYSDDNWSKWKYSGRVTFCSACRLSHRFSCVWKKTHRQVRKTRSLNSFSCINGFM